MIVWIWDADASCGVAGTAEAARRAAGSCLTSGQAAAARVEQATLVIGRAALTYEYCPTGRAWDGRLESGRPAWVPVVPTARP